MTPASGPDGKAWTILLWIAGDNNLSDFGSVDLGELKQVGSGRNLNLVAQYDQSGVAGTRRFFLRKGTTLEADAVADLGETNTGDPKVAIDFFTWGIKTYPSKHVMCVFWNHGSGIDETDVYARARALAPGGRAGAPDGRAGAAAPPLSRQHARAIAASALSRALFASTIDQAVRMKAIAYDDTSRDFLDNKELANVLEAVTTSTGKKIDVIGFDACLMNMLEIGYELRGSASYIVGSEETEPGDGWPYDRVAAAANRATSSTPGALVKSIVKKYIASYATNPDEDRVTQSAVNLAKADVVADRVDKLAAACIANLQAASDYMAFSQSVNTALRFEMRDFVDLGDLCRQLVQRSKNQEVVGAAKAVTASLTGSGGYVVSNGRKGPGVAAATGTTIYFPLAGDVHVAYDQLDFAKRTRWPELIARFRGG
jgi:hypothetical protein